MKPTKEQIEAYELRKRNLLRQRIAQQQLANLGEHDDKKYNLLTQAYQLACAR